MAEGKGPISLWEDEDEKKSSEADFDEEQRTEGVHTIEEERMQVQEVESLRNERDTAKALLETESQLVQYLKGEKNVLSVKCDEYEVTNIELTSELEE